VLPFVVLLLLLVVQVGLVVREHVRVAHASRAAVRVAARDTDDGAVRAVVDHLVAGARVDVARARAIGDPVTVRVTLDLATDLPIIGVLVPDVQIEESTTMHAERV
jgi:hypothetical protein